MAVFLAPDPIQSTYFIPGGAVPANGGKVFFYIAGSSTKQTVYKDSAGSVSHTNPIVLDSGGNIPSGGEVWFTSGVIYKVIFAPSTDTDPPVSPYWTKDNLTGMNDVAAQTGVEWLTGPTPTFVSTVSFTLAGDQTSTFQVGRRVKTTNTGGTIYSVITASAFGAVTTVTVVNDSGVLDAGLSAVSYGLLSALNPSVPIIPDTNAIVSGSADLTKKLRFEVDTNVTTATTRVVTIPSTDGTLAVTSFSDGTPVQIFGISASVAASALTISAGSLSLNFRSATLTSGTVTSITGTPANLVISSGSTLGTINATQSRIAVLALNNAGTIELAAVNISGGTNLTETGVISTTAEGGAGAADSASVVYSTTARSSLAYRVIGYIESTQATAGTWATAPSTIQGAGGNAVTAMSSAGYGQVWAVQTRSAATTYYNTTGKPTTVAIQITVTANSVATTLTVNSVVVSSWSINTINAAGMSGTLYAMIPPGGSYSMANTTNFTFVWNELS